MSEAPKFDFSRIRVGNAMGKFKPNEIALPKNNASDTVKADKPASEKTETPDTAKNDQIASQKTETPDKAKNDQIASQKTETPDTAKNDQIASQKTETPETAKTDQIASQKTETPDTVKTDQIASQKTQFSSGKQKNITESTKEIQELLAPLKANYSISSAYEKQVFVNKFKEEIRKNSRLQELLISGGTELIKIICEPLDIPIDMGEKWLITAQHYQ
jgi:hypothetical protein